MGGLACQATRHQAHFGLKPPPASATRGPQWNFRPGRRGLSNLGCDDCIECTADRPVRAQYDHQLPAPRHDRHGHVQPVRALSTRRARIPGRRLALAGEPILEVTAPLPEAQLIETMFLNLITFETTIASKAARCVVAAGGIDVIDFSFRRTQGIEAGVDVARLSSMVGFISTSNVEAARRYGLVAAGTMAHSYIESFPTDVEAFRAYAQDFPGRVTFLVDTYDTVTGIERAIAAIHEPGPSGRLGIRIDSGDLVALSKRGRKMLDEAGLPHGRIVASGGLDELAIDQLVRDGAKINAFRLCT